MTKKSMNKEVSNEELAQMIAKGFEDVTSRMATKEDLRELDLKLDTKIHELRDEMNNHLVGIHALVGTKFVTLTDYQKLEHRVARLERAK